ncbi:hypothetical protein Gbem_4084 [Citrifermentans bemidjiense Bem]|uniref:Uncharacterized protein n=1 Tax=Citrifermentans bemidjiense (strain ATCC BAA-1014 / DSM 16622 / JCM 12645 / Bem) TaxID=404380 RepID=E1P690_CITBB|nr:hypothetical protein Gbem_4084 [Citrifermentans bemidjiense Bem]
MTHLSCQLAAPFFFAHDRREGGGAAKRSSWRGVGIREERKKFLAIGEGVCSIGST